MKRQGQKLKIRDRDLGRSHDRDPQFASKKAITGGGSLTSIRITKQAVPAASSIDGWRHGSRAIGTALQDRSDATAKRRVQRHEIEPCSTCIKGTDAVQSA